MTGRTSSNNITKLKPGEIFLFGSNLIGKHDKYAAKTAMGLGAKWGQAAGLQGRTYGIPTKGKSMNKILTIPQIKVYVDDFIKFAKENPDLTFLVTEIGCGASNYKPKEIAPLFKEAIDIDNIHLPARFWHKLKEN